MASEQVLVRVLNGEATVEEAIRRPVRLTPDGYAGIAYAGAVYPLFGDRSVDISGPSWEVADCRRFLFSGSEIPYSPRQSLPANQFGGFDGEWTVETSSFGHYLVFNASERVATELVDAMESAGVSIQRWDVSHRPSSDGKFYDWFARLRFKGTRAEAISLLAGIFSPAQADEAGSRPDVVSSVVLAPTPLEELGAQLEQLLGQVADLRERVAAAEAESAVLRERLTAAKSRESELSGERDRLLEYQKALHDQIAELRRSSDEAAATKPTLAGQSEAEGLLQAAFAESAELREQLTAARAQAADAQSRVGTLESDIFGLQQHLDEIVELERERHRASQTRLAPRRGVIGFLDTAFARLTFVLDSLEVIANLENPAAIIRALVQIDMGDNLGKDLRGLRGWREVPKLATGNPDGGSMGRIYYKPAGSRVLVSVHLKRNDREQERYLKRLRAV